jgi:hypothetical protein
MTIRGWPVGPTLQSLVGQLHCDTLQEAITGIQSRKSVETEPRGRPAAWLGRPVTTWRVIDLINSVTPPWTPINAPLLVEIKTLHSTYSSPLVKVPV